MSAVEKYIQLKSELNIYRDILSRSTDAILDGDVSKYPILVVHKQEIDIGVPIIEDPEGIGIWNVHISSLEEFVTKQLIEMDKVDEFIRIYKEPTSHFCLFVISELGAQFIFMPR
jgi:hypothetical protein